MSTLPENTSSFNKKKPQEEGKKKELQKTLREKGPKNPEDMSLYQKLKQLQKIDTDPMIFECLKALEERNLHENDYIYMKKFYRRKIQSSS